MLRCLVAMLPASCNMPRLCCQHSLGCYAHIAVLSLSSRVKLSAVLYVACGRYTVPTR
jgi:hypothetical protein